MLAHSNYFVNIWRTPGFSWHSEFSLRKEAPLLLIYKEYLTLSTCIRPGRGYRQENHGLSHGTQAGVFDYFGKESGKQIRRIPPKCAGHDACVLQSVFFPVFKVDA